MSLRGNNVLNNEVKKHEVRVDLNINDIEFLLNLFRNSEITIKGKELQRVVTVIDKLQQMYIQRKQR